MPLLNVLILAASALVAVWVYFDAARNGVGRQEGRTFFLNWSPGGWASLCLLFSWPVVAMYLALRPRLRGAMIGAQ